MVIAFLARRFAWMVIVMWAVATLTFLVTFEIGNPLITIVGPHASARDREHARHYYGLDRPLPVQYAIYARHLAHGELGLSYRLRRPVTDLILERFPRTLLLGALAIFIEVTVGVGLGVLAAGRRATATDSAIMGLSFLMMSTPTFVLGKLMLLLMAYYLGLFPIGGYGVGFADHLRHAVLPALTLGLIATASYARLARNDLVEILQTDFVRTARAKGLSERTVLLRHALRNALLPIVTNLGLSFGSLFGGAVVTEAIFAWHGLGGLAYESIAGQDTPVILGTVMFGSLGIQLGNLASDLAYAVLDPRIRRA